MNNNRIHNDLLQPGHGGAFVQDGFGVLPFTPAIVSNQLAGLSLSVKDVFNVQGLRTGAGNPLWRAGQPESTSTASAVAALLGAGAQWVGKTVTDELAYSLAGNNIHYGTPVNPMAPLRIPGGSSSGAAVSVAGGHADIGLATDCGGSARLPGSYCGVWGIRPSQGLVGGVSGFPLAPGYDTVGWFTRSGAVMQRVLDVVAPHAPAAQGQGWWASADALQACDPQVQAAYRALVQQLAQHTGAAVPWQSAGSLPLHDWAVANRTLQGADVWAQHGAWVQVHGHSLAPAIRERFGAIAKLQPHQVLQAEAVREGARSTLANLFAQHGLLVLPTAPGIAPLLTASDAVFTATRERCHLLLAPAALARLPQVTLPWITVDGAPVGLSVLGPRGSDHSVVAAARVLEGVLAQATAELAIG